MTKSNNRGVALIAAVVTAVIFLMLVMTVVVISMSTYKKSRQGHDRAMALNLAEAGINYTLYCMNYRYHDAVHFYPVSDGLYFKPTNGTWNTGAGYSDCYYNPSTDSFTTAMPGFQVRFLDGNSVSPPLPTPNTNEDILESTGYYNGKKRTVQIKIRGKNTNGGNLDGTTVAIPPGIAEVFNKHVMYSPAITFSGGVVNGNITTASPLTGAPSDGAYTIIIDTGMGLVRFPIPILSLPTFTPPATNTYQADASGNPSLNGSTWPVTGVSYTGASDTFTFYSNYSLSGSIEVLSAVGGGAGNAIIDAASIPDYFKAAGTIRLSDTNPTVDIKLGTATAIESSSGSVIIDHDITIAGDLIVRNALITLDGVSVTGAVICDKDIILSGSGSTINASGSSKEAAVIAYSNGGAVTVTVNADLTTMLNHGQAGIIAYTDSGSATVTIGSSGTGIDVNGLIYAYSAGGGTGDITLGVNTGIISGALVASTSITMRAGTLTWDKKDFIENVANVYNDFQNGRRVYLPVPGSWREE